jgi:hypothetical protein
MLVLPSIAMNELSPKLHQVRGEIVHEFSLIEYHGRSYLASLLETQSQKAWDKYKEQFQLNRVQELKLHRELISKGELEESERQRIAHEGLELNERALENPDVRRMGAELVAAQIPSFDNCLDQLVSVGDEIDFAGMSLLRPLVEEIKNATRERNTLTHGVWHEVGDKVVVLTFPEYHKHKWMLIKGDGTRLAPGPSPQWTFEELERFAAELRNLLERLQNVFQAK